MKKTQTNQNEKFKDYKYRILELLQTNYSVQESYNLRKEIPKMLNISQRTFNNWCYWKKDSKNNVRYADLYKLAMIFNTTVEDLLNFEIEFTVVKPNKTA